ncbi:hypothetical protein I4U23_021925 [Adineta vaga]|nr:hypothetical protein I4U23_021925 [Adineta vaga]
MGDKEPVDRMDGAHTGALAGMALGFGMGGPVGAGVGALLGIIGGALAGGNKILGVMGDLAENETNNIWDS